MLIKVSGTHLNTCYEDVQNQDIHHKDCPNPFGKKKILCKDLLKESDFMWSNGFVLGEQQNKNNQKTKLPLKRNGSESTVQKNKEKGCFQLYI